MSEALELEVGTSGSEVMVSGKLGVAGGEGGADVVVGGGTGAVGTEGTVDCGGGALGSPLVTLEGELGRGLGVVGFDGSLVAGLNPCSIWGPDFDAPQAAVHAATNPTARLRRAKRSGKRGTDANDSGLMRAVCADNDDRSQT